VTRSGGREAPDPACHFSPSICSITAARPLGYMARRQFQDADAGRVSHSSAADDRDRRQDSGTFAWSVRSGHARVDPMAGHSAFEVEALAINGAQFSGMPGPRTDGNGHLVAMLQMPPRTHRIWPIGYSRTRQRRGACRVTTTPGHQTRLRSNTPTSFLICKT
jgi:hypothetical protein